MKVKNTSKETAAFMVAEQPGKVRRYEMKPGDTAEVEDGYCLRRKLPSGKIIPSVVERLTNGRVVPVSAKDDSDDGEKDSGKGKGPHLRPVRAGKGKGKGSPKG